MLIGFGGAFHQVFRWRRRMHRRPFSARNRPVPHPVRVEQAAKKIGYALRITQLT